MFKKNESTNQEIDYQRYATRFYVILIIISLIIITRYNATKISIQSKTIYNPTESQFIDLQQEYSHTLSCPCSSISMLYSVFITTERQFHQVCSSYLISMKWIKYLTENPKSRNLNYRDFQWNAPAQFHSLSMFCEQANRTINEASEIFLRTVFVSSQVISKQSFEAQMNSSIEDWKLTTINTFIRTIQLVRATTQGNQLSNSFNTILIPSEISKEIIKSSYTFSCNCALSPSCSMLSGFYYNHETLQTHNATHVVPNFFMGCYPIEALFASTLECFYNISCILEVDSYLSTSDSFNYSSLNASLNSPNETIEMIINKLMVQQWISNISFTSYYNQCAPSLCTYQYEDRSNLYTVISSIGDIYGGLSLGLKFIFLIGLSIIYIIIQNGFFYHNVLQSIKHVFICNTEYQMLARLHFILVTITLSILYILSAFTTQTTTVNIQNPSVFMYEKLINQSFDSIECPCSQISIKYKTFLNITPSFHQLCSSDLISNLTSSYFYYKYTHTSVVPSNDFLYSASAQFQLLASFCDLSQVTVNNSLIELGSSDFISAQLLSLTALNDSIQRAIDGFQITMPVLFVNTLSLIRETTGANMLLSILSTNWKIPAPYRVAFGWAIRNIPLSYDGCSCAISSKCVSSSRRMLVGCYPLESILQATFDCFYNKSCIDQLFDVTEIRNLSALTSSRFPVDTKFESILSELMIEKIISYMSYELYFNQCAPSSCIYTYIENNNVIEGITILIGLYGGLVIICRLIAIIIVKYILYRKNRVTTVND